MDLKGGSAWSSFFLDTCVANFILDLDSMRLSTTLRFQRLAFSCPVGLDFLPQPALHSPAVRGRMRIVEIETLICRGAFASSERWSRIFAELQRAVQLVDWPAGSGKFTIYPQSGKKRGEGNGVAPIKLGLMAELAAKGWKEQGDFYETPEQRRPFESNPGKFDAVLKTEYGRVSLEWETGNISSSHRAVNKMALGMLYRILVGGVLIVPSRKLYPYLTDRIGNFPELEPYLDLWRSNSALEGVLVIIVIEQDAESLDVPRIPKGTDGRALG